MITIKVHFIKSFAGKLVGLLGSEKAHAIYFKTRFGIHTFGMKFAIDVIILDKENKVVKIKENLMPNKLFFWNPKFDNVIELSVGEIKKHKIKVGDKINVVFLTTYQ